MSECITAFGGAQVPINDLEVTLGYTAGFVTTLTVSYGIDYVQTIVRDGSGNPLSISQWIPQSGPSQLLWVKEGLPKYISKLNLLLHNHLGSIKKPISFLGPIDRIGVAQ